VTEKEFAEQMEHNAWLNHRAAIADAEAVCDLHDNLKRLAGVCENLVAEVSDPGTEARAAIYCARECLAKYEPKPE
jgi:hypothetical protein